MTLCGSSSAWVTNWKGNVQNRPKYWGNLVNELIYQYLDPDVFDWLKTNAPAPRHGQNYHQWLSSQYGLKKLVSTSGWWSAWPPRART